ncbi:hypothetical protein S40288_11203 [Stachybotrys chartarum IBT 40288]|nr:hypothetical protein S40288_11203 [Stachybotrys chartarum IBT 40288]
MHPPLWPRLKLQLGRSANIKTQQLPTEPPPYDDKWMPLSHDTRVMHIVEIMLHGMHHAMQTKHGMDWRMCMVTGAAIREGCVAAATVVNNAFLPITGSELNNEVNEAGRKVANAILAATSAVATRANMIDVASGASEYIVSCGYFAASSKNVWMVPRAVSAHIASIAEGAAAAIIIRLETGATLSQISLPPRSEFLPGSTSIEVLNKEDSKVKRSKKSVRLPVEHPSADLLMLDNMVNSTDEE